MTKGHEIKVKADFSLCGTKVWIDDKEINGVQNIQFEHPVNAPPVVVLTISPNTVEISGEAATAMMTQNMPVSQEILWANLAERLHDGTIRVTPAGMRVLLSAIPQKERLA
jgi:hypothetical protein